MGGKLMLCDATYLCVALRANLSQRHPASALDPDEATHQAFAVPRRVLGLAQVEYRRLLAPHRLELERRCIELLARS